MEVSVTHVEGAGTAAAGQGGGAAVSHSIRAIPTTYGGILFRSRLEALYAAAFDEMHIGWAYEHVGLDMDGTWYLPDFWLPDIRTFFEVKGAHLERMEKPWRLARFLLREELDLDPEAWAYPDKLVVVGDELGRVSALLPLDETPSENDHQAATVAQCDRCQSSWFMSESGWWRCRQCAAYSGSKHLRDVQGGVDLVAGFTRLFQGVA
jgi:hypothetical protein